MSSIKILHDRYGDEYDESDTVEVNELFLVETIKRIFKIHELLTHYKRFQSESYAKCSNITTISKDRIIFINDMDPCGRFTVNDDTLDRIDQKVAELYIK